MNQRYVTQSLATLELSFDPFSRLAVQRWPSVTASCVQWFQMAKTRRKQVHTVKTDSLVAY
jgi:hypothetical protein